MKSTKEFEKISLGRKSNMLAPYNLVNEIRAIPYCVHRLIDINLELEAMNHALLGLSHNCEEVPTHIAINKNGKPKFNKYGDVKRELDHPEWSEYPMPSYHGQGYSSPLGLMEEISKLENDANYYRKRILDCRWSELLDIKDQNMIWDLYMFKMPTNKVAKKYGYSKAGMYKHINNTIQTVIIGKE